MEVLSMSVPVETLRAMPPEERTLLLAVGYVENQLNMMIKLLKASVNAPERDLTEAQVSSSQTYMLVRQTIGVVVEAWNLISARVIGPPKYRGLVGALSPEGQKAKRDLNRLFGGGSLLSRIRNRAAFHIPDDELLTRGFEAASADVNVKDGWCWFIAPHGGLTNANFFASELVVIYGISTMLGEPNPGQAQERIMQELFQAKDSIGILLYEISVAILGKHFAGGMDAVVVADYEVPHIEDVSLPYFVDIQPRVAEG